MKKILIIMSSILLTTSCIKDFEEVNKNPLLPDENQKTLDGLASVGLFPGYIAGIIPTATGSGTAAQNNYQVTSCMTGDIWSGYVGVGTQWDGGTSTPNFNIKDGRKTGIFNVMLKNTMETFLQIKAINHDVVVENGQQVFKKKDITSQANYSIAQIIKIMGAHRLTDMYGPIPYSKIGGGNLIAPYDSQQQVYSSMLAELQEAVETLNTYKATGGTTILSDNDPLYQGDVSKWIKLGNSLMLRLAMRVRYADATLCQTYVTKATTNDGGLITDVADVAKLVTNGRFRFFNSYYILRTYTEANMGANIYSYLKGYSDPRASKYFSKKTINNAEDFYAVRMGSRQPKADYAGYSEVNIEEATPTYWFKASEVQFLLAEAALFGLISTDTAQNYYENGVKLSFRENDVEIGSYLTTSAIPVSYTDPNKSDYNVDVVSTIDRKWLASGTDEEHLEQIITQKYIANFPNGVESWSEWRRTGYPRMFAPVANLTNVSATNISTDGKSGGVRRVPFSIQEFTDNRENMSEALSLLNGADNAATNVWWDKKTK
ncbi:MAG: SusD/RagB family nutrient-binding outer membrane lipoprotein [Capnocytophaga sp.]|nr:SusD/RagB family nutrient-binding outer membrane lipoprotein [Capnocytophaga sp.]